MNALFYIGALSLAGGIASLTLGSMAMRRSQGSLDDDFEAARQLVIGSGFTVMGTIALFIRAMLDG